MIFKTKNNKEVLLRRLNPDDFERLFQYLQELSPETTKRFGPHPFDTTSIVDFYGNFENLIGYIGLNNGTGEIIAYSIIRLGYLQHDSFRLLAYGLTPDNQTDCTFAPSVADQWQSQGVGNRLFQFILSEMKTLGMKRIILWGGVQCDNQKAVNYYLRNGFRMLGQFETNVQNYDMVLDIG